MHRPSRLQITLQGFYWSLCAMQSYQLSVFHNLLADEIARYGKIGLAVSDSLQDACALVITFMFWFYTALRLPGSQTVWCVFSLPILNCTFPSEV